jgi:hypothetical protein
MKDPSASHRNPGCPPRGPFPDQLGQKLGKSWSLIHRDPAQRVYLRLCPSNHAASERSENC